MGKKGTGMTELPLTTRSLEWGARDDDGGGTAVVSDRDVQPVWQQRSTAWSEHCPQVGGVLFGGIKVSVVANFCRPFKDNEKGR